MHLFKFFSVYAISVMTQIESLMHTSQVECDGQQEEGKAPCALEVLS